MRLWIGGGCGEHGRNCFLLEGEKYNIMLDCGVMVGAVEPLPRLSAEQIQRTRYVLLSHAHKDHTGAAEWLVENGFQGIFLMTTETARQLPFTLPNSKLLPTPENVETFKAEELKIMYGMSGHCAGSVWYMLTWHNLRVFYSGDYHFYSSVYQCTHVQKRKADLAIIDSCYPEDENSQELFTRKLESIFKVTSRVLLPVPKYGRGLDLLLLFIRHFPSVHVMLDSHMQSELNRLKSIKKWIRPDAYQTLHAWAPFCGKSDRHVLLLADPQLESTVGQYTAKIYAQEQYPILFSGNVDTGTYAKTLIDSGKATCCILPVHNSDAEYRMFKRANRFQKTIPFHTDRLGSDRDIPL